MKRYILLANRQKDIEFQYADFFYEKDMELIFFNFSRLRIGLLKIIDILRLKNSKLNYILIFKYIFDKTIKHNLTYSADDEYVFIINARVYEKYGSFLVRYLRGNYASCKVVIYLTDLIHTMRFSMDDARREFDVVCSFDKKEAEKNNLHFILEPFSMRYIDRIPKIKKPQFDVTFVGSAKNRYDLIVQIYKKLSAMGLKCDFYVVGVKKGDRRKVEGIHYRGLSFEDLLRHVANSKCVLEIMQDGGYSATTRYAEAMLLNRNLLTDCPALYDENEESIIILDDNTKLSKSQICTLHNETVERFASKFSIRKFVQKINDCLHNVEGEKC